MISFSQSERISTVKGSYYTFSKMSSAPFGLNQTFNNIGQFQTNLFMKYPMHCQQQFGRDQQQ